MGVEPTIRLAKSRIAGFEGREDHRSPCASAVCVIQRTKFAEGAQLGRRRMVGGMPDGQRADGAENSTGHASGTGLLFQLQ